MLSKPSQRFAWAARLFCLQERSIRTPSVRLDFQPFCEPALLAPHHGWLDHNTLMRNTFPKEDCIQLGTDPPHPMLRSVQQYKEVTSSEAVGKGKTVKTCKHSFIPRIKLLCKSFSVQTKEQFFQQSWQPADLALQRHKFIFFRYQSNDDVTRTIENSDQSGPLHPLLPNADPGSLVYLFFGQSQPALLKSSRLPCDWSFCHSSIQHGRYWCPGAFFCC